MMIIDSSEDNKKKRKKPNATQRYAQVVVSSRRKLGWLYCCLIGSHEVNNNIDDSHQNLRRDQNNHDPFQMLTL
jgi:hypothetical protein